MSIYESSSRPTSYISHQGGGGSEDGDPWAVHEGGAAQEAQQSAYSLPAESDDEPSASGRSSEEETTNNQLNGRTQLRQPTQNASVQGPPAQHDHNTSVKASQSSAQPVKHVAAPSSSSSTDPWGPRSPGTSSGAPDSHLPRQFANIPTSSSAIRGGFNFSNGSHETERPSSPYEIAKSDLAAQKSTLTHLKSQPGPWDDEQVFVSLRPELEGLIFKYNSYNIIRRPNSTSDGAANRLAGPSTRSTLAYTQTAHRKGRAETSSSPSSSADDSYTLANSKTVVRRYSDFVWMNEVLVKRYPFRIVPILPPKRLSIPVAGRHLSSDDGFMERRRRGLQRYLRALVSHPVIGRDELVQTFLTEKQPLSEWRQSHSPPATEEEAFTSPPQPSALLSIPSDLAAKLEQTTNHTSTMVEKWTNFVNLFERISKRLEAQGLDYSRLASQLDSLTSVNQSCFKPGSDPEDHNTSLRETCNRLGGLNRDYSDLSTMRARVASETTLEQLKAQRDLWMAFRDLVARHGVLATDNVASLKQRIATSRAKVSSLQSTPVETRAPSFHADVEKLEASIQADSLQVESLLKRREFIRLYMWEELNWLWKSKTEPLEQTWKSLCRDELVGKSAEKRAVEECWKDLGEQ